MDIIRFMVYFSDVFGMSKKTSAKKTNDLLIAFIKALKFKSKSFFNFSRRYEKKYKLYPKISNVIAAKQENLMFSKLIPKNAVNHPSCDFVSDLSINWNTIFPQPEALPLPYIEYIWNTAKYIVYKKLKLTCKKYAKDQKIMGFWNLQIKDTDSTLLKSYFNEKAFCNIYNKTGIMVTDDAMYTTADNGVLKKATKIIVDYSLTIGSDDTYLFSKMSIKQENSLIACLICKKRKG